MKFLAICNTQGQRLGEVIAWSYLVTTTEPSGTDFGNKRQTVFHLMSSPPGPDKRLTLRMMDYGDQLARGCHVIKHEIMCHFSDTTVEVVQLPD